MIPACFCPLLIPSSKFKPISKSCFNLQGWRQNGLSKEKSSKSVKNIISGVQVWCKLPTPKFVPNFLVSNYIEKVQWNQISLSSFLFKISRPETWRQIKVEFWLSQNEKSKPLVDFSFFSFMRKTEENKGEQILVFSKPKIKIKGRFCFSSLGGRVVVVLILEPGVVVGPRPPPCVKKYFQNNLSF